MKTIFILLSLLILLGDAASQQTWEPLGSGMSDGIVYTLDEFDLNLIAGGTFQTAGGVPGTRFIAKWNGFAWSTVGAPSAFSGNVYFLTNHSGELIAAGEFNVPGNLAHIARWNGSTWNQLGGGVTNGIIYAVHSFNGSLYAAGTFTQIAGIPANRIAKWDGSTWSALGSGINGTVIALSSNSQNGLVAGGQFNVAGGVSVNNVAQWNGTSWSAMGSGLDGAVQTLTTGAGSAILAGGAFTKHIKYWTGSDWTPLGGGIDTGGVFTIYHDGVGAYAGGVFNMPGVIPANIAYYGFFGWGPFGSFNDHVLKIFEQFPNNIYAAGRFTMVNGVGVNRIAKLTSYSTTYVRINLGKTIQDLSSVYDTIRGPGNDVSMNFVIADVNLMVDTVFHSNDSDLEFTLIHGGIRDTAIFRVGGSGDNFIGTVLNDSASIPVENGSAPFTGQFRPSRPLSQFIGTSPGGDWILQIHDRAAGNTGVFNAWSLRFQLRDVIGIKPVSNNVPLGFSVYQNYPNPFNPITRIRFDVSSPLPGGVPEGRGGFVSLRIFDILGREVTTLVNEQLKPGTYEVEWNAENSPSGAYFYRLTAEGFSETKKMILIR